MKTDQLRGETPASLHNHLNMALSSCSSHPVVRLRFPLVSPSQLIFHTCPNSFRYQSTTATHSFGYEYLNIQTYYIVLLKYESQNIRQTCITHQCQPFAASHSLPQATSGASGELSDPTQVTDVLGEAGLQMGLELMLAGWV